MTNLHSLTLCACVYINVCVDWGDQIACIFFVGLVEKRFSGYNFKTLMQTCNQKH